MTREDFKLWAEAHDCEVEVVGGLNHTGSSLRLINTRFRNFYTYIDLPLDREMPDNLVRMACERLHIPEPDCVKKNQTESEKDLRKKEG